MSPTVGDALAVLESRTGLPSGGVQQESEPWTAAGTTADDSVGRLNDSWSPGADRRPGQLAPHVAAEIYAVQLRLTKVAAVSLRDEACAVRQAAKDLRAQAAALRLQASATRRRRAEARRRQG